MSPKEGESESLAALFLDHEYWMLSQATSPNTYN